ncbi:MAG TPA: hypothetical protein V6D20_19715, partial [Candidatus Obscuribacterales bacterium]
AGLRELSQRQQLQRPQQPPVVVAAALQIVGLCDGKPVLLVPVQGLVVPELALVEQAKLQ